MKVFLINLDRDKERFAFVDGQLKRLNVDYERVSGVDAKSLSPAERAKAFSPFRWWCTMGRPVADGEIGCALSHYAIYRRMADDEALAYCCILEDDVELSSQLISTLCTVERWIDPAKPQVVLLNDHQNKYGDLPSGIHRSRFGGTCTDGYVLTRVAAKNLLEANLPIIVPCDTWWRWVRQGRMELFHAVPAVVRQRQDVFGSMTLENRVDVAKFPLFLRLIHKVKRGLGKAMDECLVKLTGK